MHLWIYILLCENGAYYTGYTTNLEKRFQAHLQGKAKYTRSFKPLKIAQQWQIPADKSLALKLERFIKKLSRPQKINLIQNPEKLLTLYEAQQISEEQA